MAIGRCVYATCLSMIGSSYRGSFLTESDEDGRRIRDFEVLLCPEHERLTKHITREEKRFLWLTREGVVYDIFMVEQHFFASDLFSIEGPNG